VDLKNYLLKKKQLKSMRRNGEGFYFTSLPFHCPKCHWGTDTLKAYVIHLENHLIKKKRSVRID
jgi:hypothetical protein